MNGYTITAQALRKHLQECGKELPEEARSHYERQIKINDFLGGCSERERNALFDSTAFNDIVKGYVMLAAKRMDFDSETQTELLRIFNYLFDEVSANQAEQYYKNH